MEIHEYLVLKHDGTITRFPVLEGDVAQAQLRAVLCQRPGDSLVAVTDNAFICVHPESGIERLPALATV